MSAIHAAIQKRPLPSAPPSLLTPPTHNLTARPLSVQLVCPPLLQLDSSKNAGVAQEASRGKRSGGKGKAAAEHPLLYCVSDVRVCIDELERVAGALDAQQQQQQQQQHEAGCSDPSASAHSSVPVINTHSLPHTQLLACRTAKLQTRLLQYLEELHAHSPPPADRERRMEAAAQASASASAGPATAGTVSGGEGTGAAGKASGSSAAAAARAARAAEAEAKVLAAERKWLAGMGEVCAGLVRLQEVQPRLRAAASGTASRAPPPPTTAAAPLPNTATAAAEQALLAPSEQAPVGESQERPLQPPHPQQQQQRQHLQSQQAQQSQQQQLPLPRSNGEGTAATQAVGDAPYSMPESALHPSAPSNQSIAHRLQLLSLLMELVGSKAVCGSEVRVVACACKIKLLVSCACVFVVACSSASTLAPLFSPCTLLAQCLNSHSPPTDGRLPEVLLLPAVGVGAHPVSTHFTTA